MAKRRQPGLTRRHVLGGAGATLGLAATGFPSARVLSAMPPAAAVTPALEAAAKKEGKIAFYTGIIDRLQLTDDEIAAIMGHEIAHALREHARERASQTMMTNIGVSVLGAVLGAGQMGTDLIGTVAKVSFQLPNSREHETEADRMGVELAARGGYDPRAAISLWQKMAKASNGGPPQWLSTHPSNETRQGDLAQYASRVMPLYEQATQRPRAVK